ncbi:hypothetical protein FQA39_LY06627 [Lamprigera yunnana]|nr:hypothetical protein FQA39_LY06627 [Lamprigera yunnana]
MLKIYCFDGVWKVIEAEYEGIPDCGEHCTVKCLNGGICVGGNKCKCVGDFVGTHCEIAVKSCTPLPNLDNQKSRCTSTNCLVTCSDGYEFSNGGKILEFICLNGEWTSFTSRGTKPICQPICNPPCQNEGICAAPNKCKCTSQFAGFSCEYNKDVCDTKSLSFNGRYDCQSTDSAVTCILSCPNGTYTITEIEPSYTCKFSEGKFFPANAPLCLKNLTENIAINQTGTCFTWSGTNYKTFKGKLFFFRSSCAHILLEDSVDSTFSIIIQNSNFCSKDPCSKVLKIFYDEKEYVLKESEHGTPVFTYGDKVLAVPGKLPGIRVEMVTHHLVVNLDAVGVKLKWNGQQYVQVDVAESLWNKIGGLCGTYNGTTDKDLITKDGLITKNVETFVKSWQSDSSDGSCCINAVCVCLLFLSEKCKSSVVVDNECGNDTFRTSKELKATTFCKSVLNDSGFAPCKEVLNIEHLLESCILSYCSCTNENPKDCLCDTFTMYARECASKGVADLKKWRDAYTCPIPCTGGKVYQLCAPEGGVEVCGGATENINSGSTCEEGCYCPAGTVLHNFRCIAKDDCPCTYNGKDYSQGSTITKNCNSCTCDKGKWTCTENICTATCSSVGDPHYVTFDGKRYDFMGHCTYYLVKQENYSISAENVACTGQVDEGFGVPPLFQDELPSCTKAVILDINGHTFQFKQNLEITIDGKDITKIPVTFDGVTIRSASSQFIIIELPDGVAIRWDGIARAYVDAPPSLFGKTQGLCGTFNNNQKDDFLTPAGDIEENEIVFGNKWKTDESCPDYPVKESKHPCDKNVQKKAAAQKSCKVMKSKVFADCHWDVDPEPFYQECLYDMCSCELKPARCLCPMIAQYAAECTRHGITVDWRGHVKGCGIACKGGQKYQVCANPCARTCSQIASSSVCTSQCVEGCNCPDGETMDGNGDCIPISQCECEKDDVKYPAGYKEIRVADSNKLLCTCTNAKWECSPSTPGDDTEHPHEEDNKNKCQDDDNREFTLCEPTEPATCKNMHDVNEITPSVCQPGCKCKEGYVLDTVSKKCIKPTDCPCYHGGQSYDEDSVIRDDCNNCTCQSGKWICSKEECPAECSAWGDSHFQTYDGKMYSFQGQCDYVLSKGEDGSDRSFQIAIQNVPCGSFGVACSKSLTITAFVTPEKETVTLDQDKRVPKSTRLLLIREISNYVFVEIPELGVTVTWDKGTRVYVKLSTLWKNKVKGLCGNYNDNNMDDFQTPDGGFTEVSSQIFGDSWRLQPYCSESIDVTNTCDERPNRKMWALKKCDILKSPIFAKCHVEVSVEPFLRNCIFDTCACDQGGDCECLCTALAAYAHECSIKGVHIKWRTPKLCPMQCDDRCSHYHPCVSTCPVETCENTVTYKTLSQSCQNDVCVEGCKAKECEPGFIFLNSEMLECVPKNVCKPSCMIIKGKTYYEGELIEKDDWHSCYCLRGKKHCQGQPCITVPV